MGDGRELVLLHIGGASTASVIATVVVIFFLIFAVSFAFGPIPQGRGRFSAEWMGAWFRASLPRIIVAGVFSGLLAAGALLSGDGGSSSADAACEQPLPPLTGTAVTDARILVAIDDVGRLAEAARAGQPDQVRAIFATSDAHNLMHDIDARLRDLDSGLAKDLCRAVIQLEEQMPGDLDTTRIAEEADKIAAYLQEARPLLQDVTPAATIVGESACAAPIGAVTSQPLTAERIQAAAASLEQAAGYAAAGNLTDASLTFYGDAHNLSHDIDGPLRQADAGLALELCESILAIEREMGVGKDLSIIEEEARKSASLMRDAGSALGIIQ